MDALTKITRFAPTAANYAEKIGKVVLDSGVASSKPRATLAADGTGFPMGILTYGEDALGGKVAVCISGRVRAFAGAAISVGALVMADANGDIITHVAGNYYVGRYIGEADAADGDFVELFVQPGFIAAVA